MRAVGGAWREELYTLCVCVREVENMRQEHTTRRRIETQQGQRTETKSWKTIGLLFGPSPDWFLRPTNDVVLYKDDLSLS